MDDRVDDGPATLGLDLGERRPKIVFGEPPVQRCPRMDASNWSTS